MSNAQSVETNALSFDVRKTFGFTCMIIYLKHIYNNIYYKVLELYSK